MLRWLGLCRRDIPLLAGGGGAGGAANRLKGSPAAVPLLAELLLWAWPGRSSGSRAAALSCFGGLLASTCINIAV